MDTDSTPDAASSTRGLPLLLPEHHVRLLSRCRDLLAAAYADDSRELVTCWCELETELVDHMAAEEELILPRYAAHAPAEGQRIAADHARMRELLTPMGVEVELHESRASRLRQLVDTLEAHAAFEDAGMYPWAERNLGRDTRHLLGVRIGRWLRET